MAEIKSTLDLVMQKTRHLTLSPEEKAQNEQKALSEQIRGLVQQYQDGLIDAAAVKRSLGAAATAGNMLAGEVLDRIDPEQENHRLFVLLEQVSRIDTRRLSGAIDDYRRKQRKLEKKKIDLQAAQLSSELGISGSAVVPNLDQDEVWQRERGVMKETFSRYLETAKTTLRPRRQDL